MGRNDKPFTLYWSSMERYENCPQEFLWMRGWKDWNLGGGFGEPKPKPFRRSEHHPVMGLTIGDTLMVFYNEQWWRLPPYVLKEKLEGQVESDFKRWCQEKFVDWRVAGTKASLLKVCHEGVRGFLRTLKHNKLLAPYASAEVDLGGYINEETPVRGRADIVLRWNDARGTTILDGKNSKSKGKYTDPDQLRWYALCHYLQYGVLPKRVGFVYYRYPYGTPLMDEDGKPVLDDETGDPKVEQGVDWVEFSPADIRGLAARAVQVYRDIMAEKFDPVVKPSNCKWCDYETVCEARQTQLEKGRAKRRVKKEALISEMMGDSEDGFFDL